MSLKLALKTTTLKGKTTTENGDPTYKSSNDLNLDFFYNVGSMRGQDPYQLFLKAYQENPDLAFRTLLWLRDVREGAGERQLFRDILTNLALDNPIEASKLVLRIPELGRWDDLLPLINTPLEPEAISLISTALSEGNPLCAKWMPRTKNLSKKIRKYEGTPVADTLRERQAAHNRSVHTLANKLGFSMNQYRKLVSSLSSTVEQQMCSKQWSEINYSHVPSRASKVYQKAFFRNDEQRYQDYLNALTVGSTDVKINAGAIFPHDVIGDIYGPMKRVQKNYNVSLNRVTPQGRQRINAQWEALPNYLTSGARILPIVDVSGSMSSGSADVKPIQISISLGIYLATKQQGPFKNLIMTFSSEPTLTELVDAPVMTQVEQVIDLPWDGNTDLDATYDYLLNMAKKHNLPQSDMPEYLFIVSDMQFDSVSPHKVAYKRLKSAYKEAGYELPTVIFWNVNTKGGVPLKADTPNTALISGYSPSILKSILANPADITPLGVMLNTLLKDRYNY